MPFPKSVCVFCGSQTGLDPVYAEAANQLGERFGQLGIRLVFGGGHIGLMGVTADAALKSGGMVTGVIPQSLQDRELAHPQVEDMHVVDSMHTRKALMAKESAAFIALPGGMGTFEELCEILTWGQLGFHRKPIIIFNLNQYYAPLLQLFDQAIESGFMKPENRQLFHVTSSVEETVLLLQNSPLSDSDDDVLLNRT